MTLCGFTATCARGLAIGIRAAEIALREIRPHAEDEEVIAIVATDMCAVDAIQYLVGCTFGSACCLGASRPPAFHKI